MAFSDEQIDRIITTLNERMPSMTLCVCGAQDKTWTVAEGIAPISILEEPGGVPLGGRYLPGVALVCNHCGHIRLFNLITLGLGDLAEPGEKKAEES